MNKIFFWTVVAFVGGALFTLLVQHRKGLWNELLGKARLIRSYWQFVIAFVVASTLAYWAVLAKSQPHNLQTNLTLLGQILPLVFAIFIGYFAFLQVVHNRFDSVANRGFQNLRSNNYLRAKIDYEEAVKIDPRHFVALANLLELYLIVGEQTNFDNSISGLDKLTLEDSEKLVAHYLKIARQLLVQDLGKAKEEVDRCVNFVKGKKDLKIRWGFQDMQKSDIYKNLNGDPKTIFENTIKYMLGGFDASQKEKFESGNYTLSENTNT